MAREGILKLVAYLEERNTEESEPEATYSSGSEMSFYRGCLAEELPQCP